MGRNFCGYMIILAFHYFYSNTLLCVKPKLMGFLAKGEKNFPSFHAKQSCQLLNEAYLRIFLSSRILDNTAAYGLSKGQH